MSHAADADEIRAVLARSAGPPDPAGLACEQIFEHAVASATAGIWRFARGPWSVVLKVLRHQAGGSPDWRSGEDEDHWYYWRREALAYSSGLLDRLSGSLRAPRCFGVFDRADGSVGLWLEDLRHATPAASWALEGYRSAAFALGRAQGGVAVSNPLPGDRWLARDWLRRYVARRERFIGCLDDRRAWRLPVVRRHLRPDLGDDVRAIWNERERLLAAVEAAPRTLCHLDLHPGNLFSVADDTVLIDWAFVGLGALGEDAGNLIFDAVLDFFVSPDQLAAFAETITDGYLEGLEASRWPGDTIAVIRALHASAAVKYVWILPAMLQAAASGRDTLNGRPLEDGFAWWAQVIPHLIVFARRA